MTRRRLTRLALVLAACGAGLLATPAPVQAATLEQQGWWFRLRPAGLPSELPSRPDVAEGQLVVEGAPDEAVAVSAVRFALADGESSPVLTLNVVDHVGTPRRHRRARLRGNVGVGAGRGWRVGRPRLPGLHDLGRGCAERGRHDLDVPAHRARCDARPSMSCSCRARSRTVRTR